MFLKYSWSFLFVLIIFLSSLTKLGSCLQCYSCISTKSSFCGDEFEENRKLLNRSCPSDTVCFRTTSKFNIFGEIVTRGCGKSDKCDNSNLLTCGTCTEDFCNSSSNLSIFSVTMISVTSLLMLYFTSLR